MGKFSYYAVLVLGGGLLGLTGCKPSSLSEATPTPTPAPAGRVWQVAGDGDDKNDGHSEATAFRSLAMAAKVVAPGDTVLIGNGSYTNPSPGSTVLNLTISGQPDAWITWKPRPGAQPEIHPTGWNGINVGASYQIIEGLKVIGANDSIIYKDAIEDASKSKPDARFNTNGITISGREKGPAEKPHHIIVRHCTVAECPGGGIVGLETDYLTIEDNLVYDNAWFMRYGGSGITTLGNWAHDDAPGYHIIIQRNQVWRNMTKVQWTKIGKLSDGNGILLDVTDQENNGAANPNADGATNPNADAVVKPAPSPQAAPSLTPAVAVKPPRPEWKGRALIANNISAYNGGSGIHTFRTRHVDIINNTVYSNGHNVGYPDLFANRSDDVLIFNNIIVPRPGGKVTSNNHNTNLHWDYNLYSVKQDATSLPQDIVTGPHDLVADPMFKKIADDVRDADFHLQPGSPALDSGTEEVPQATDLSGTPRPAGQGRDRGAYEQ